MRKPKGGGLEFHFYSLFSAESPASGTLAEGGAEK